MFQKPNIISDLHAESSSRAGWGRLQITVGYYSQSSLTAVLADGVPDIADSAGLVVNRS